MSGNGGQDPMNGGSGNDDLNGFVPPTPAFAVGDHENDQITGGSGNDLIQGNGGSDVLNGGAGNDIIYHFIERVSTFPDSGSSLGFTGTDTITCGSGTGRSIYEY
jgi:Ca2+-binding RTX toxin-like protein